LVVGILRNFYFLYQNVIIHLKGYRLKSLDLILRHLIFANTLVLLSKGLPHTMAAFGLKHFLSDFGCKLVSYVHRVATAVSFTTTCLLSILQAIMISPRNSTWTNLKLFSHVSGKWSNMNITKQKDLGYCSSTLLDKITSTLLAAFLSPPSTLSFGLMIMASGYMVFILTNHSTRSFPETRASPRILALVSTFLSFYILCPIFATYMVIFNNPSWWPINISALMHSRFPTVSPFSSHKSRHRCTQALLYWLQKEYPSP
ncbi:hypothetical protein E2I00_008389, partial [Balaenoptera physalus]